MSYIEDDHVEFAVVMRLNKLLQVTGNSEFEVSHAYGLFTALLTWTMQRLRQDNDWEEHFSEKIDGGQWLVFERNAESVVGLSESSSTAKIEYPSDYRFEKLSDFLIKLRDSVAHGDHRAISPIHSAISGKKSHKLTGFAFKLERRGDKKGEKNILLAEVSLGHADMLRLGNELASRFESIVAPPKTFVDKANNNVEEAA